MTETYVELGKVFAEFLDRGRSIYQPANQPADQPADQPQGATVVQEPVVITGAALGLPGVERVFDDENIGRILDGEQFIDAIPHRIRQAMVDKHITRLVKPESGEPSFVIIDDEADVIKLAAAVPRSTSSASSGWSRRATTRWTRSPAWPSVQASTPCATPASRSS